MKLYKFGLLVNAIVLSLLFGIFLYVNVHSVEEFLAPFTKWGSTDETVRLILDTIKLDLTYQWLFLASGIFLYMFLLASLVFYPLCELDLEYGNESEPNMFFYGFITIVSLPLLGGVIMLLALSGLKHKILKFREYMEESDLEYYKEFEERRRLRQLRHL